MNKGLLLSASGVRTESLCVTLNLLADLLVSWFPTYKMGMKYIP